MQLPVHVSLAARLMWLVAKEQRGELTQSQQAEIVKVRRDLQTEMSRLAELDLQRPDHPFHKLGRR
jgi:hypothetical protein